MTMDTDEVHSIPHRRICSSCVGEEYLRDQINAFGDTAKCSYCSKKASTISIEDLASHVKRAIINPAYNYYT